MAENRRISRREFMRNAGLATVGAAAASVLSSCAPKVAPTVAPQVTKEPQAKNALYVMSQHIASMTPTDEMIRKFNASRTDVHINAEIYPQGWTTKAMAMVNAGNMIWSGLNTVWPAGEMVGLVESGTVIPFDEYFAASTQEGAKQFVDDMIPACRTDGTYKGKWYMVPYSMENIWCVYRTDYYQQAGIEKFPETWDEMLSACAKLKAAVGGQGVYPFSFVGGMAQELQALLHLSMTKPYRDVGLVDILSSEAVDALEFMREMVEKDYVPTHLSDDWRSLMEKGKLATMLAQSSRVSWYENAWGQVVVDGARPPVKAKGIATLPSPFWTNSICLFKGGPNPQAFVDFLIYAYGPQNQAMQTGVVQKAGKNPAFKSVYDNLITKWPNYAWQLEILKDVQREGANPPLSPYWEIEDTAYTELMAKFTEKGSTLAPKDVLQQMYDRIEVERAKIK